MDRQEIEAKVKEFLIEDLEIDEEKIQPEARLKEDIGIDSLDFLASRSRLKRWRM